MTVGLAPAIFRWMKTPQGLEPIWLMMLALALGVLVSAAVPVLVVPTSINATAWMSFVGSLVGGAISITAVVVATRNVRRQMRIGILSREEERMEGELPGLHDLANFLSDQLVRMRSFSGAKIENQIIGLSLDEDNETFTPLSNVIDRIAPNSDKRSRQKIRELLDQLKANASDLRVLEKKMHSLRNKLVNGDGEMDPNVEAAYNLQIDVVRSNMKAIRSLELELRNRIHIFEDRLPRFRNEIEAFFDQ